MIQAVKAWQGAAAVLALSLAGSAWAAEDSSAAARDLARQTAAFAHGEPVAVIWRNVSSLDGATVAQIRSSFESAWQDAGVRTAANASSTLRITLSENPAEYLLVGEAQGSEDHRVWMTFWKRTGAPKIAVSGVSLDKKLLWEQDAPILDVAFVSGGMLVLSPSSVSFLDRTSGQWQVRQTAPIAASRSLPRDPRGRLRAMGGGFQALLPGVACTGATAPSLTIECRPSDQPWTLESGARWLLLANYAADANYFDGRIVTQTGTPKTVPPFYSAAAVVEQGRASWLLATVENGTQIYDANFALVGSVPNWGSDLAGTDAPCSARPQILATRPGDGTAGDAVQAFALAARSAAPLGAPALFAGAITAIWPNGATAAIVVARDPSTSKYSAYLVTVTCGS